MKGRRGWMITGRPRSKKDDDDAAAAASAASARVVEAETGVVERNDSLSDAKERKKRLDDAKVVQAASGDERKEILTNKRKEKVVDDDDDKVVDSNDPKPAGRYVMRSGEMPSARELKRRGRVAKEYAWLEEERKECSDAYCIRVATFICRRYGVDDLQWIAISRLTSGINQFHRRYPHIRFGEDAMKTKIMAQTVKDFLLQNPKVPLARLSPRQVFDIRYKFLTDFIAWKKAYILSKAEAIPPPSATTTTTAALAQRTNWGYPLYHY